MNQSPPSHVPVMVNEVVEWLRPMPGQVIVDGTLGGGGHTAALAQRVAPGGLVVALDRDPATLAAAETHLAGQSVKLVAANFRELPEVLRQLAIRAVDGILLDLGLSSDQLADPERGFSFDSQGPFDLRFDPTAGEPTWRWLERIEEKQLADVIYQYGEERYSRRIAHRIIEERSKTPIRTARQLAEIVRRSLSRGRGPERIDPATRTFQALRIAVNEELESLTIAMEHFADCLTPLGRLAVISFHSLEDRIVKHAMRNDPRYRALVRKPLVPSEVEVAKNPRSRSAKMRVAERVVETTGSS
jgi:16S rRNA (cytosine1402-N4)-methyltransferase